MSIIDKIFNFIKSIIEFLISLFVTLFNQFWDLLVFIFNLFLSHPIGFILSILTVYYLVIIIIDIYHHTKYKIAFNNTVALVKYEFGYAMYLFGKIRSGKSTCMSALTHAFTYIIQGNAQETIAKVKGIIIKADWSKIDSLVNQLYQERINYQIAANVLIERFPQWLTGKHFSKINLDVSYQKLIESYVEAMYALIENNYVLSPRITPIYNRITKTFSKTLIEPNLKIKEAYDSNTFGLSRYKIICVDEKGLDPDKKNTSTMQNASVDDGFSEGLKIFGNAGKETMYFITTNQDFKQYLRSERALFPVIIEMKGLKILPRWKILSKLIKHLNSITQFNYSVITFFHFGKIRKNSYLVNENIFKKIFRKLNSWNDYIFSKSYILYDVNVYTSEEDIGKKNTQETKYYKEEKLIFPITYAFGNLDTHVYSFVFDELMKNSNISFFDIPTNNPDLSEEEKAELVKALLDRSEKAIEKKRKKKEEIVDQELPIESPVPTDFLSLEEKEEK